MTWIWEKYIPSNYVLSINGFGGLKLDRIVDYVISYYLVYFYEDCLALSFRESPRLLSDQTSCGEFVIIVYKPQLFGRWPKLYEGHGKCTFFSELTVHTIEATVNKKHCCVWEMEPWQPATD